MHKDSHALVRKFVLQLMKDYVAEFWPGGEWDNLSTGDQNAITSAVCELFDVVTGHVRLVNRS